MPISRRQFDQEIDPKIAKKIAKWIDKIHKFFDDHTDEAFTEEEVRQQFSTELLESLSEEQKKLYQVTGKRDVFVVLPEEESAFMNAVKKLIEKNRVEKKTIRGVAYYAHVPGMMKINASEGRLWQKEQKEK